jgi:hypothetical protein
MIWHDPEIAIPAFITWTGFILGGVRFFLVREIKRLEAKLDKIEPLEEQVIKLDMCLANRPQCLQHTEMAGNYHALNKRIDSLSSAMGTRIDSVGSKIDNVAGRLEGIGRATDLMNQFLIEQGGKR